MDKARLKTQLIADEDEVLHAYTDSLGFTTIGVGRLIDKRKGGGISHDESMYLLDNDIRRVYAELTTALPWVQHQNDARQNALLNMAFQLGTEGLLEFKLTLAYIQGGHYEMAAQEMLMSKWARQTPERAKRASEAIRSGVFANGA